MALTPEQMARRKKLNKVLSAVTGAILVFFFVIYALTNDKDHPSSIETSPTVALILYKQAQVEDTSTARRKRAQVSIYLAEPAAPVSPDGLAATCMAAAKYYAREYNKDALSVFLADLPGDKPWEGTRLAQCSYSPDHGGWSGDQDWTWTDVKAAPRGLTDQERKIKRLWGELRAQYQTDGGTDEAALSAEVAKRMGIQPDQVSLLWFLLEDAKAENYAGVKAQGPVR